MSDRSHRNDVRVSRNLSYGRTLNFEPTCAEERTLVFSQAKQSLIKVALGSPPFNSLVNLDDRPDMIFTEHFPNYQRPSALIPFQANG
jgi:hypothetical protein